MVDPQFLSSPARSVQPAVASSGCPGVADLLQYALGQSNGPDRQRIESHLQHSGCRSCRSWVDKAIGSRDEPGTNEKATNLSPPAASCPSSPPTADRTPISDSSKWQRQAFSELERTTEIAGRELIRRLRLSTSHTTGENRGCGVRWIVAGAVRLQASRPPPARRHAARPCRALRCSTWHSQRPPGGSTRTRPCCRSKVLKFG